MRSALLSVIFGAVFAIALVISDVGNWENTHYARTIDLSRGYVKETDLIQITNDGDTKQKIYYFTLNDGFDAIDDLSIISVGVDSTTLAVKALDSGFFEITLPKAVSPGDSVELRVSYVYLKGLEPVPKQIDMADSQQLVVKLNKMPYSPYSTKEYSLRFIGVAKGQEAEIFDDRATANPVIEARVEEKALVYGPIVDDIEPFSVEPFGLIYEHQQPLAKVENLHRSVWIPSAADQVQFEEYYELTNQGAELDKGFSRVDWMHGRYELTRDHWALKQLEFPMADTDFDDYYFTDKVGMVSTHKKIQNFLVLQPRFPLFGGWHYNFTLGWNQPIGKAVHKIDEDTYIARAPLLNSARDVVYKNVYLSFYLPEGAEFVNISAPLEYKQVDVEDEYSYLDVAQGHTKVTLKFENMFDDLGRVNAYIVYRLPAHSYLKKALKISGYTFAALFSYYLLTMLDLSV
ncbi:hypothetical protein DIURU_004989 [Diutina rugosa]|uniref:Dolichyl-diphosphooligosaccharide--protein glycosyltransferase subunit 1 n=1 Tax=Diutina rugosa TaxID=5481 RepID=A0A642UFU1_DIURU|nr:uncharacterized protein DIURU_004989 [Diutina rugosa]KAA8898134.1 hypothetical protein DIURU_004989 [Diutina rugosa]